MKDWWPLKWSINFNPRKDEYRLFKGWVFGALTVWAAWASWALVAAIAAAIDREIAGQAFAMTAGWTLTAWACWGQWYRRVM